jgi:hypothetical protein
MTAVDPSAPPGPPGFGEPGYEAFDDLWSRLARPIDLVPSVAAVVGLPLKAAGVLVGATVAMSPEAEALLDAFPRTIRSLATSMKTNAERCIGALRGPVLWSETMSARSASYGDPDLFVCATPSRAYDVDENRVLVHALVQLREAAELALASSSETPNDHRELRVVRDHLALATRYLDHPSLREVARTRVRARAVHRTRTSKHRRFYAPAIRFVERADHPLAPHEIRAWREERTRAQHHVLMGVVHRLEHGRGRRLPDFRLEHASLVSGDVAYRAARYLGDRGSDAGIRVGELLIDVPDRLHDPNRRRATDLLRARAGGGEALLVMDERDIDRAVELVLERHGPGGDAG